MNHRQQSHRVSPAPDPIRPPLLPAERTLEDLVDIFFERNLELLSLLHVGGDGWLKTLDFVPRDEVHLKDLLSGGERADGSSIFANTGIRAGASDIVLVPRPETAFLDPFSPHPTLAVLCGHTGRDGRPLPESPDTIVRRAFARVRETLGVELFALGEVEYFLGRRATEEDVYGRDERGYHATSPFVFGEPLRREAVTILSSMGVPVKYAHSEVGYVEPADENDAIWEQHEIELALAPLPEAADAVVLTRWVLMNLAHRRGMRITFEPIVRVGHAGSGLHFHFSPRLDGRDQGGRGADGELFAPARWLIAGLVRMGGALMAFGNRTDASFIRLRQGKEAPNSVTWGEFDRRALVRLPVVVRDEAGRALTVPTVEFRLPDGSAHPHLVLASVAQTMVEGARTPDLDALLANTRTAGAERPIDASPVPRNFSEVSRALAEARETLLQGDVFPASLLDRVAAPLSRGPETPAGRS